MRLVSSTPHDSLPFAISPQESQFITIVAELELLIPNKVYTGAAMRGFSLS